MKNKKAQSEVITTILLILLAIALVSIVAGVIVPMINNILNNSQECYEALGKVSIDNSLELTCYQKTTKNLSVSVHYGDIGDKLNGFAIEVILEGGSSKTYKIEGSGSEVIIVPGVFMYNGNSELQFPGDNEERTYTMDMTDIGIPSLVNVYPIVKSGKVCDKGASTSIEKC